MHFVLYRHSTSSGRYCCVGVWAWRVVPGIYSLWQKKGAYVHAYLVDTPEGLLLIDTLFDNDAGPDPGPHQASRPHPQDLRHIILTHAHRSHLGGLALLKELSGAPIYAHEWECDLISGDRAAQQVSWRPQPAYRTYIYQLGNNLNLTRHPPATVDCYIHEGDRIGPLQVHAHAGPFAGPPCLLLARAPRPLHRATRLSPGRASSLAGPGFLLNKRAHQQSLRKMAEVDAEVLCTGHGEPLTSGAAARVRRLGN